MSGAPVTTFAAESTPAITAISLVADHMWCVLMAEEVISAG